MASKRKVVSTALASILLAGTLWLPAIAETGDSKGQKIEVHSAPANDLERKVFELQTQVDKLFDPSLHFGFPWFAEPFAWRSNADWLRKNMEQLASKSFSFDTSFAGYFPRIERSEDEKQVKISAEVPGIDESHLDVSVSGDMVTIKGQKEESMQAKDNSKRSYRSFERMIKLPYRVDSEKAEATLKNGVLTVTAPKLPNQDADGRKISIRRE